MLDLGSIILHVQGESLPVGRRSFAAISASVGGSRLISVQRNPTAKAIVAVRRKRDIGDFIGWQERQKDASRCPPKKSGGSHPEPLE